MKILYHHRTLGDGAEGIHIREMVKAFRNLGHEVRVIGPTGESLAQTSPKFTLLSTIKRATPRAIFEMVEVAYTGYALLKTLWAIKTFRPDFVYDRYIAFNAGPVMAGMLSGVPVLLEVNAPLALERSSQADEGLIFRRFASSMERWICSHATRAIVVSTPLKEYLERIGVPAGKCVVMPNGVDPEAFFPIEEDVSLRDELGIPSDAFVIGFTGVLRSWHGLDLLVNAFASLSNEGADAFLLIVGDGPYRPVIEEMAEQAGVRNKICITGRVSHTTVPRYVALFDVAVSPRATFYASPMKVLEYMALGKPVLVPATANFLDMVDNHVHGVTFEDGSVLELRSALAHLYESPAECARLGRQAREKVEARLNWNWNALECCGLVQEKPVTEQVAAGTE